MRYSAGSTIQKADLERPSGQKIQKQRRGLAASSRLVRSGSTASRGLIQLVIFQAIRKVVSVENGVGRDCFRIVIRRAFMYINGEFTLKYKPSVCILIIDRVMEIAPRLNMSQAFDPGM